MCNNRCRPSRTSRPWACRCVGIKEKHARLNRRPWTLCVIPECRGKEFSKEKVSQQVGIQWKMPLCYPAAHADKEERQQWRVSTKQNPFSQRTRAHARCLSDRSKPHYMFSMSRLKASTAAECQRPDRVFLNTTRADNNNNNTTTKLSDALKGLNTPTVSNKSFWKLFDYFFFFLSLLQLSG